MKCSVNRSVKFTLSLLSGAKLKLTLTDCENITNQFATKREVVHHQKRGECFEEILFIATHSLSSHIIGKLCLEQKQSKKEEIASFRPITTIFTAD